MIRKEGELPEGSLSNYVLGRLDDIARQKTEAERQAKLVTDRMVQEETQRMAEFRERLLDLATPSGRLFNRFHAVEIMEEVQSKYSGSTLIFWNTGLAVAKEYDSGVLTAGRYFRYSYYTPGKEVGFGSHEIGTSVDTYKQVGMVNLPAKRVRKMSVIAEFGATGALRYKFEEILTEIPDIDYSKFERDGRSSIDPYVVRVPEKGWRFVTMLGAGVVGENEPPGALMKLIGDNIVERQTALLNGPPDGLKFLGDINTQLLNARLAVF